RFRRHRRHRTTPSLSRGIGNENSNCTSAAIELTFIHALKFSSQHKARSWTDFSERKAIARRRALRAAQAVRGFCSFVNGSSTTAFFSQKFVLPIITIL